MDSNHEILPNRCVMPGMREEAAEKIDAGLRAALTGQEQATIVTMG